MEEIDSQVAWKKSVNHNRWDLRVGRVGRKIKEKQSTIKVDDIILSNTTEFLSISLKSNPFPFLRHDFSDYASHIKIKSTKTQEVQVHSKTHAAMAGEATKKELVGSPIRYNGQYTLQSWRS
ncbi:hypothetical protein L6452_39194 [Arctium lappa]|uniref:Uncharacterized protein n=1 Tax=Arctium lappa TaxID=4217 RepID=A0ACB8XSS7_ARCLA|nr:hypothetical protein L6452_39194 [Arctium lappa]